MSEYRDNADDLKHRRRTIAEAAKAVGLSVSVWSEKQWKEYALWKAEDQVKAQVAKIIEGYETRVEIKIDGKEWRDWAYFEELILDPHHQSVSWFYLEGETVIFRVADDNFFCERKEPLLDLLLDDIEGHELGDGGPIEDPAARKNLLALKGVLQTVINRIDKQVVDGQKRP